MRGWPERLTGLGLLVALAGPARAETPPSARFIDRARGLSAADAVARALAQEPSLRAAQLEAESAQGMRQQAARRPNPEVMVERRDVPRGMDAQTMASVEWPLELGRRAARVTVADRRVETASLDAADRARRLAAEVRQRYGAVAMGARVLDVLADMADVTRRQRDLVHARVEAGASPPVERDAVEVELGRLEAEARLQEGRVEAALAELRRLLAVPAGAPLLLAEPLEDARLRVPGADGPADGGAGRVDVRAAESRVAEAAARVRLAEREGRPELRVFGGYMRMDSGFPQQGYNEHGHLEPVSGTFHYVTGGLKVTVPFSRNEGEVAAARVDQSAARAAAEAARLTAGAERSAAEAQLAAAQGAVRVLDGTRATARRLLDVVSQSHDLGRASLFDVLSERRRFVEVERAYVEAVGAEYDARVMVNLAAGGVR